MEPPFLGSMPIEMDKRRWLYGMRMPQEDWSQEDGKSCEKAHRIKAIAKQLRVQSLPEKSRCEKERDVYAHCFRVGGAEMNQERVSVSRLYAAMP